MISFVYFFDSHTSPFGQSVFVIPVRASRNIPITWPKARTYLLTPRKRFANWRINNRRGYGVNNLSLYLHCLDLCMARSGDFLDCSVYKQMSLQYAHNTTHYAGLTLAHLPRHLAIQMWNWDAAIRTWSRPLAKWLNAVAKKKDKGAFWMPGLRSRCVTEEKQVNLRRFRHSRSTANDKP